MDKDDFETISGNLQDAADDVDSAIRTETDVVRKRRLKDLKLEITQVQDEYDALVEAVDEDDEDEDEDEDEDDL